MPLLARRLRLAGFVRAARTRISDSRVFTGRGAMTSDESNLDEVMRLAALRRYGGLDRAPAQALDDLVSLAAQICEAPVAAISLVHENRGSFKAQVGHESREIP